MKNKKYPVAFLFLLILLISACTPKNLETMPENMNQPRVLNVMTHDSFAVSESLIDHFETENNVKINFLLSGDTGAALNRAILTKESPQADIFFGVDNTFISRALEEEKRRMRFQFISVLAHELKSPINAVDGYLDILQHRPQLVASKRGQQIFGRCRTRIEGMRQLILDLLDLTRIESGEKKRTLATIDVAELSREIVESFQNEAQAQKTTIALSAPQPARMLADRSEIELILPGAEIPFSNLAQIRNHARDGVDHRVLALLRLERDHLALRGARRGERKGVVQWAGKVLQQLAKVLLEMVSRCMV